MNNFESNSNYNNQEIYEDHLCNSNLQIEANKISNIDKFNLENNHIENSSYSDRMAICVNCNKQIIDPYILRVDPNLEFHANCLACCDCSRLLDENCKAFVRGGKTYCQNDYLKLFGKQCTRCRIHLEPTNMVMRAGDMIYHLNCFTCAACEQNLRPGDRFLIREQEIFCGYGCYRPTESPLKTGFFPNPGFSFQSNELLINPSNCIKNDIKSDSKDLSNFIQSQNATSQKDLNGTLIMHQSSPTQQQQQLMLQQQQQQLSNGSPQTSLDEFSGFSGGINSTSIFPPFNHVMSLHNSSEFGGFSSGVGGAEGTLSTSSGANSPYSNPDSVAAPSSINSGCGGGNGNEGTLNNGGSCSGTSSSTNGSGLIIKKSKKDKPAQRIRTVLNETQLKILKQMYAMNQRPDTITKETLVERTGLSARVIRVWFQNKRCKDKKRQNALKELQQHQEKEQALHGVRLNGVGPLIASSPSSIQENSQNSSSLCGSLNSTSGLPSLNPIDIRQFPQNPALWNEILDHPTNNSGTVTASTPSSTTNLYLQQTPLMMQSILSSNNVVDLSSCQTQQQSFATAMNYGVSLNNNGMSAILTNHNQSLDFLPQSRT